MCKNTGKKGFTLTELLVVVFILGILSVIGYASYAKVVEQNRARNMSDMLKILGTARRMQILDNNLMELANGDVITDATWNPLSPPCPENIADIDDTSYLHHCGYASLKNMNWNKLNKYYESSVCGGVGIGGLCCSADGAPDDVIACSIRREDNAPDYAKNWKYFYSEDGSCTAWDDGEGKIPACEN